MAEPSLKVVSDSPSISDGAKSLAKKFPRKRLRMILLVGAAADRAGDRRLHVSRLGPLHHDRQRLCRRAEGPDHAGHLRQDRAHHRARGPARQSRRRAVRDRPRAVPHRRRSGAGQARHGADRVHQPEKRLPDLRRARRCGAAERRAEKDATSSARRRWPHRAPARRSITKPPSPRSSPRSCRPSWPCSARIRRSISCSATRTCRSRNSRAYMQAAAALEQAQRDLDHTLLRAPIDGMATQVDNIQLGRFVTAGTPVFCRDRRQRALGRCQPEGNRHHQSADRPARHGVRRHVPGHDVLRHRRIGEPGHRRAIRDPAAAERQRQLGQGGAARAAPRPARQGSDVEQAPRRHERLSSRSTPASVRRCSARAT